MRELDRLKEEICLKIDKYKEESVFYVRRLDEMERLSDLHTNFSKVQQTQIINALFAQGPPVEETKIQDLVNCYFDENYNNQIDECIEELRGYEVALDELKKQNSANVEFIAQLSTSLTLNVEQAMEEMRLQVQSSVEKVLEFCANRQRLGLESLT